MTVGHHPPSPARPEPTLAPTTRPAPLRHHGVVARLRSPEATPQRRFLLAPFPHPGAGVSSPARRAVPKGREAGLTPAQGCGTRGQHNPLATARPSAASGPRRHQLPTGDNAVKPNRPTRHHDQYERKHHTTRRAGAKPR